MDDAQWDAHPETNFRSLSAFPLVLGESVVGVLKLENKRHSDVGFPESDQRLIRELTLDIAVAVKQFSLLDAHEEKLIKVPFQLVAALLDPSDPKQLLQELVRGVAETLNAEICSLWLVDSGASNLRLAEGYGFSTEPRSTQTYRLAPESARDEEIDGITAWVAIRKKSFWANSWTELKNHPSWKGKWDKEIWRDTKREFRCLYAVPLLLQQRVIGVLKVENPRNSAMFTNSDRAMCGLFANLIVLLNLAQQIRTALISDLVHVIRAPIGQVPMNLSGLIREIDKLEAGEPYRIDRMREYVNIIKRAILSVTITSRTLGAFATAGSLHAWSPEPVPLARLVEERLTEIEPLLYGGIRVRRCIDPAVKGLTVDLDIRDRTRVQIVIDNLLHNAIKYSRKAGEVEVSLTKVGDSAVIQIQDHGLGIKSGDLPRVFEPGFTRRAPEHPEGTGMGLTTVSQILDRVGWQYSIQSDLGSGTRFEIRIPLKQGDDQCANQPS
jgi:signal transduction histidine kinase